ncbi:MAG: 4Fe-4S binding protein [Planctomycetota bacterium]|nr:4Fe-4S binding protein [Planctomycetota bacterium]
MALNIFLGYRAPRDAQSSLARRALGRLGPSWEAAPVRRFVQAAALILFLGLFFYVAWPYGERDYAAYRESKELVAAEMFLALDPLVGLSASLAARTLAWSLAWAAALGAVSLIFPRGFCGYLCPLGTLIDLSDWAVGRRIGSARVVQATGWRHLRYYVLAATLASAAVGVLAAGFVAAMPVLVRGMAFIAGPIQMGLTKGWYLVPPVGGGQIVSILLFAAVPALALVGRRFWCRCVCPSGAVFSAANLLRLTERRVSPACTGCGKCVQACPFDAIRPDFSTRGLECTFCQTCGGVCPVRAITFTARWAPAAVGARHAVPASAEVDVARHAVPASAEVDVARPVRAVAVASETPHGQTSRRPDWAGRPCHTRRGFLGGVVGGVACGAAAALGVRAVGETSLPAVVRPPGSVPETEFLRLCIRCGECYQACPNNVLQPIGFERTPDDLWTPRVVPNWSGCEPSCNNCGHVCPTGAIRALPMPQKRAARMGLAGIDTQSCLPYIGFEGNCRLCADECHAAGYDAIDLVRVNVALDTDGTPIEGSGNLVPVVNAEKCVGCGLCQTRCHKINVLAEKSLDESAIRVAAGPGKEDRLMTGSYLALREAERRDREAQRQKREGAPGAGDSYLPDFLK